MTPFFAPIDILATQQCGQEEWRNDDRKYRSPPISAAATSCERRLSVKRKGSLRVWRVGSMMAFACLVGCGGGGGSAGTKVTSELASDEFGACFVQGTASGGRCFPETRFNFVLTDGGKTQSDVLGEGAFRIPICRNEFVGAGDMSEARCEQGQVVACSEVAQYETSTDGVCPS
jgi:hypothetical protein